MKLGRVLVPLSMVLGAWGFADTAPFYSSQKVAHKSHYIQDIKQVSNLLEPYFEEACAAGKQVVIYRVKNLQRLAGSADSGSYIPHVHYDGAAVLDLAGSSSGCEVRYLKDGQDLSEVKESIVVVDVEGQAARSIGEFTGKDNVIVQGVPSFEGVGRIEEFKNYLEDHLEGLASSGSKKEARYDAEEEYLKIVEQVEEDFRAAESFIAEEGDGYVTAFASPSATAPPSTENPGNKVTHANLFVKYQFFTPAILSALIVSFFLIFVLYVALSWITSLEISYHAFEKQVDYEKKND